MAMTRTGRHTHYVLPPAELADWPPLAKLRAEYERLLAQHQASGQQLARLEDERVKAEHVDRRKAAGILRKRPAAEHPGFPERDKVDEALAAERARRDALAGALEDVERELEAVVQEHRAAWVAEVEAARQEAREALRAAVEAWAEARQQLRARDALVAFLEGFPERASYRAPADGPVAGLTAPHGGPFTASAVLEALRAEAEPPAEPEPSPHVTPVGNRWPVQGVPGEGAPPWAA